MKISQQTGSYPFLQGGGEMGELTRSFDWSGTSVGAPGEWPQSLKTTVSNLLRSKFPMFLWWGDDMIQFYNDAYRPSMGNEGKHPSALGAKGPETWPEIWPIISPLMQQVQTTGEATWMENQLVPIYRNGKIEDVYWTYSYSSVLDENGNHNGILVTCMETTETVIAHKKIEESQQDLLLLFEKSPVAIAKISKEDDLVFEFANSFYGVLVGRKTSEIIGKPLLEVLPEIKRQGFDEILKEVIRTGNPFIANELAVDIYRETRLETIYIDLVYQPWADRDGSIDGVLVVATDVTVQVLARKKVEESEERSRIMADMSPNLIWMLNPDGSYKYVNKTTLHFLNITQEEIADVGWAPFLHPDDMETATETVTKAVEYQKPYEMEHRLLHKDGCYRWVFSQAIPAFDADGKVYAFVGSSIDIHEKRQMEIDLRNSEARFRNMIEQAPIAITLTRGMDLVIESINAPMLQLMNKSSTEEVLGRKMLEVLPELEGQPALQTVLNVQQSGIPFRGEEQPVDLLVQGELKRYYFNFSYTPIMEKGSVAAVLHVAIDVTQQVLARQKLEENEAALSRALEQVRLSKEAAELGTFDMDLETGTMHWDLRCRNLFGISHNLPVSFDQDFIQRLHPEDQKRVEAIVQQAFDKSLSNGDYDVEYRTIGAKDGAIRWVRAKGKVYFNSNEKPVRFIGSVLDISDQVMAIQKIERLVEERTSELAEANHSLKVINKELQRSNQNLEEFAHAASHDLKEPVRKITYFTQQLKDQLGDRLKENESRSFTRIANATERMGNLIDDLLLYSHVSHRPQETETVDLNEKVKRVLEDLELDIEEKKAIFRVGKLPIVNGYSRQLQQLFQNLISNALKYSKTDEPAQIDITASQSREGDLAYDVIEVKDNGIGFEQQYADKIFHMFSRLHGKHEYSGTGVGLSIVKKVVENLDGFIRVESEPGQGSVFSIYLPVLG